MEKSNRVIMQSFIFKRLHRYLYLISIFFVFSLAYPLLWYYAKDKNKYFSRLVKLRRWIALKSSSIVGIRFEIDREFNIDLSQNYIICANHTSNLDISALMAVWNNDFSFIGKHELLENRVTSLFFKTIDIPINRSSKISSYRAFKKAQSLLKRGKSVALFPEGGIDNAFPPELGDFKIGAFKLAADSNIPILPVIIHDAWKLCWDDGVAFGTSPGICHISVLKSIEPRSFLNAESLRKEVYLSFQNNLETKTRNISSKHDSKIKAL